MKSLPRVLAVATLRAAVAVLALAVDPAIAAEDGGTRSVFATGAGNRALALGGAYIGIADDASAALWNAGGLGWVAQSQLQVSQADLNDEGFRETFAGFVLPRWGWGAASLTYRQFGTDGIEARDDRNLLLGENLAQRESEIQASYGRAMSEAWSLGAALKLRRQEVAGRSGVGLGADLGLMAKPAAAFGVGTAWARDVTVGLSLFNVLEPAIRLDRESVQDPAAVRMGMAVQRPLFSVGHWLASLDLESAREAGTNLRAGVELSPVPAFALRAGLDGGRLTAGTGLRFGVATLDYAFEDGPLGGGHRAGLSWRLGPTMSEAQAAAERAEEERLASRLAEIERRHQQERVASLLAQAESARQAGDTDQALETLGLLRALEPDNAEARALETTVLRDRGAALEQAGDFAAAAIEYGRALAGAPGDSVAADGLARSRRESDLRATRSAEVARRFATALDAFSREDLAAARSGFQALLQLSPADSGARVMLRRVEGAITQRVRGLLEQAQLLTQAGLIDDAMVQLERVRALDPQSRSLAAAESALERRRLQLANDRVESERARRAAQAASAAKPSAGPARLTAQQQREAAEFYKRGLGAMEGGRTADAVRYFELVWSLNPAHERVAEYLEREYQTRGMEAFAAGKLQEAVSQWERALRVDPTDARTLGYLARAHEQMARSREISGERP